MPVCATQKISPKQISMSLHEEVNIGNPRDASRANYKVVKVPSQKLSSVRAILHAAEFSIFLHLEEASSKENRIFVVCCQ